VSKASNSTRSTLAVQRRTPAFPVRISTGHVNPIGRSGTIQPMRDRSAQRTTSRGGGVGAPSAVLGFGVLAISAALTLRFTGRRLAIYTALVTISGVAAIASLARMVANTSPVTNFACVVLVCVLTYQAAPSLSRRLAGIRLPVFPSATSRWVFEARPDLPTTVVRADGGAPVLEGPASVRDVVLQAERARSFLSGLLLGLGVLMVVSLTALADPHTFQRWLPLLLAGFAAGFLMLRGRSYVDRWQAISLAVTSVLIVASIVVRYALELQSPLAVSMMCEPKCATSDTASIVIPGVELLAAVATQ